MNMAQPTQAQTHPDTLDQLTKRYRAALERRTPWEGTWRDCFANALPQREGSVGPTTPGAIKTTTLYDGTAPDAVEQLAASLLAELTPPWTRWFSFEPGPELQDLEDDERDDVMMSLEDSAERIRNHFERSNFAVEIHQAYLDLVTAGTACLLFEEAPLGDASAFRFSAVPLGHVAFEEGADGRLETTFRHSHLSPAQFRQRFSNPMPADVNGGNDQDRRISLIEAVTREQDGRYRYRVFTGDDEQKIAEGVLKRSLIDGWFDHAPFINFRWMKVPGEVYGRSPVMKALPDIKTANKVVELVLKNASISVTGIWQADDDGVLNPATVELVPGTIIPKAVGSSGLTPLEAPGRFDVSEIVLDNLRGRIRSALMADDLGPLDKPGMTATEVVERAAATARRLGATFGRLQAELLIPLLERAIAILVRRGEIASEVLDRNLVEITWQAPMARAQARSEARDVMLWIDSLANLGPEALATVDTAEAARWLAASFGVPPALVRTPQSPAMGLDAIINQPEIRDVAEQAISNLAAPEPQP